MSSVCEVRDVEKHYTDGWYTVLYDGEGILEFNMDVTSVHRESRNRIRIYVNLTTSMNNGIGIRVSDTREDDPVRHSFRKTSKRTQSCNLVSSRETECAPMEGTFESSRLASKRYTTRLHSTLPSLPAWKASPFLGSWTGCMPTATRHLLNGTLVDKRKEQVIAGS